MTEPPDSTDRILTALATTIRERRDASAGQSYTRSLLDGGPRRCAKKFGEEAVELVIAATGEDDAAVRAEAADVLYHLLVLIEARAVPLAEVLGELARRTGVSGHEEKARRPQSST
ncbi:MAG TPA: phosphoribosyl-ATP diphosphatase [Hyphomicrobiaceae bacterium]|nr:phosphoribosyl-ATP diphosphatase [Hyphomicrobiaceae bacterium]